MSPALYQEEEEDMCIVSMRTKKNQQRIKLSIYILDARNKNQPQGIRIDHQII
jgi:hypothetical protein